MERVVANSDILSLIFNEAACDKKTLARSARVCRDWFEPALRVLWEDISDIEDLFRLLPVVERGHGKKFCYKCDEESDWDRFRVYAKFVKKFHYAPSQGMAYSTVQKFHHYRPSVPVNLLPNIECLQVFSDNSDSLLNSVYFMTEDIRALLLGLRNDPNTIYDLFNVVLIKVSNIIELGLAFASRPGDSVIADTSRFAVDFARAFDKKILLEDLRLSGFCLTPEMLLVLVKLPRLKSLTSDVDSTTDIAINDGRRYDSIDELLISFSNLENVTLPLYTLIQLLTLPPAIHFIALRKLVISTKHNIPEDTLTSIYKKIALRLNLLEYLQIAFEERQDLHFGSLYQLSGLQNLSYIQIACFKLLKFNVTDSQMEALIQNWPQLKAISLPCIFHVKPILTLGVLASFSKHCRFIENITIYLDARKTSKLQSDGVPMTYLKILDVGFSPISNPDAVALYLGRLCTNSSLSFEVYDRSVSYLKGVTKDDRRALLKNSEGWSAVSKKLSAVNKKSSKKC